MTGKNKLNNALIVGASGFIGSSLTRKLLKDGCKVTGIVGESGLQYLNGENSRYLKIYSSKEIKGNYAKLGKFSHLFNFSGYIDVRESFSNPLKYEMNKPLTTIRLMESGCSNKFINISTANVYDFTNNPLNEKSPLRPVSPYAISQLSADYYTEVLSKHHNTPYLILRLLNPYGPPNYKKGIIATIINELIDGKEVTLFNPQRRFDFTYIDDIVSAIVFCSSGVEGIVNIGCAKPISLARLYKTIASHFSGITTKPKLLITDKYKEEIFCDNHYLKKLGFKFKYDIERGIRLTVEYFKKIRQQ